MTESNIEQIPLSNKQFLDGVFREHAPWAHVCAFPEPPDMLEEFGNSTAWAGNIASVSSIEQPDSNTFATISVFNPQDDGRFRRVKTHFRGCFAIMIDDIGDGPGSKISPADFAAAGAIEPSWIIETSYQNYQYGFILSIPETNRARVEALLTGLVGLDLVEGGKDPGMTGVTRYFRLPVGSNTKSTYGEPFPHRLVLWQPDRQYTLDQIASAYGLYVSDYLVTHDYTSTPLDAADDPVLAALQRQGLVKKVKAPGHYDISCPWRAGHTRQLDNGSMYFSPSGYKCHHGSCSERKGPALLAWLRGADAEYAAACETVMPFEPVPGPAPAAAASVDTSAIDMLCERADKLVEHCEWSVVKTLLTDAVAAGIEAGEMGVLHRKINAATNNTNLEILKATTSSIRRQGFAVASRYGLSGRPAWTKFDERGDPLTCIENFQALCDFFGIRLRHNRMSHRDEVTIPDKVFLVDDKDNLEVSFIADLMAEFGLGPRQLARELAHYVACLDHYHPFIEYLDAADLSRYDYNCPMYRKLLDCLQVDGDPGIAEIFIRKWLISVVAAAREHPLGVKGVLVFSGPQHIGKTSFFRYLVPEGMFNEALTMDMSKDAQIRAASFLVSELGELDATFRKADLEHLKGFLSAQEDILRAPYAHKASHWKRRSVFCATVNQEQYLHDNTGNSRFWPVAIRRIDLKTLESMVLSGEMHLMWQEIDQMYRVFAATGDTAFSWHVGERDGSLALLDKISQQHYQASAIEEKMGEAFDWDSPPTEKKTMGEICAVIGVEFRGLKRADMRDIIQFIFNKTGHGKRSMRRGGDSFKGYLVPPPVNALYRTGPDLSIVETSPPADTGGQYDMI